MLLQIYYPKRIIYINKSNGSRNQPRTFRSQTTWLCAKLLVGGSVPPSPAFHVLPSSTTYSYPRSSLRRTHLLDCCIVPCRHRPSFSSQHSALCYLYINLPSLAHTRRHDSGHPPSHIQPSLHCFTQWFLLVHDNHMGRTSGNAAHHPAELHRTIRFGTRRWWYPKRSGSQH